MQNRRFVVVLRGSSAGVFPEADAFNFTVHTPEGPIAIRYRSRWLKRSNEVTVPGQLWLEACGPSTDLESALQTFSNAGLLALPIIVLAANAAIGQPDIELGYEVTEGLNERPFFQQFIPEEGSLLRPARNIDVPATAALAKAVSASKHRERLMRAMAQYQLALENWTMPSSILAVAHLWMAVEALTKVRVRVELETRRLANEADLAKSLGVEIKQLDSTIRRQFIFHSDDDCYSKTLEASDGFEHGFAPHDQLHQLTFETRHRAVAHVRREILDLVDAPADVRSKLLADPFDKPIGDKPLAKYMRGRLIGSGPTLAKAGSAYPFLRWRSSPTKAEMGEQVRFEEKFTPELAEGISFRPNRLEVWKRE